MFQPGDSYFTLHTFGPTGNLLFQFGQGRKYGGDPVPVTGDFDGDGKTDVGVYQPGDSYYTIRMTTSGNQLFQFGQGRKYGGAPIPMPPSAAMFSPASGLSLMPVKAAGRSDAASGIASGFAAPGQTQSLIGLTPWLPGDELGETLGKRKDRR